MATMKLEEIPMREERRIISDLMAELVGIYQEGLVKRGAPRESMYVMPVVYSASFVGRGITISKISQLTLVPRATVERRLAAMEQAGFIERRGNEYRVPEDRLKNPPANVRRAIAVIIRAAQDLQRLKK